MSQDHGKGQRMKIILSRYKNSSVKGLKGQATHQVGIHLPAPQPLLSSWPQGEGVLEATGKGEGDRWLYLQGAKPPAESRVSPSQTLVLFFPPAGLLLQLG